MTRGRLLYEAWQSFFSVVLRGDSTSSWLGLITVDELSCSALNGELGFRHDSTCSLCHTLIARM